MSNNTTTTKKIVKQQLAISKHKKTSKNMIFMRGSTVSIAMRSYWLCVTHHMPSVEENKTGELSVTLLISVCPTSKLYLYGFLQCFM